MLHIFCTGAVSHLDTWDYKPELIKRHGQPMPGVEKLITFQGENGNLARSPWTFRPRGESGKYISDLLPHLAGCADDLCFIHSLTSKTNTHGPGEMFMSTGFTLEGFPSMGAWVSYALGTENQDLPAYVAIPDPRGDPQQGPANWTNGFLPAVYQGTAFNAEPADQPPGAAGDDRTRRRCGGPRLPPAAQRRAPAAATPATPSSRPGSPPTSWPAGCSRAPPRSATCRARARRPATLYGLDDPNPLTAAFGRNCLLARRLLERGVRFITLFNGAFAMGEGVLNWDGHRRIKSDYNRHGPILDKPAAALLIDLKARGLLDDTLVVWTTEFGRMPTFQKGHAGPRPQPQGVHRLARRRRRQARVQLRRHRRVRPPGRRESRRRPRLPRDDPAPAGPRPRAAHLQQQRHVAAAHRRPRPRHPGCARLRNRDLARYTSWRRTFFRELRSVTGAHEESRR